jgi:hypothetical protein
MVSQESIPQLRRSVIRLNEAHSGLEEFGDQIGRYLPWLNLGLGPKVFDILLNPSFQRFLAERALRMLKVDVNRFELAPECRKVP